MYCAVYNFYTELLYFAKEMKKQSQFFFCHNCIHAYLLIYVGIIGLSIEISFE